MLNHGWSYSDRIGRDDAGRTALGYLAARYRHSTPQDWAQRFGRGEIEIDGTAAGAEQPLRCGQVVVWHRPAWAEDAVPRTFAIVHEDDHLVVVDKPSGLPTLPAGGFLDNTLLALLRACCPEARPVHRLGRHTSGLVVFARTPAAAAALSRAWRRNEVVKLYRALASGAPPWDERLIDSPIGPVAHPMLGTVHAASPAGKPSRSVARVLERRRDMSILEVRIETGRPHQIRIHLAAVGHPLVGDPLYAVGGGLRPGDPGLPGDGGYLLHAQSLGLRHPASGEALELHAPPPPPLVSATAPAPAATASVAGGRQSPVR